MTKKKNDSATIIKPNNRLAFKLGKGGLSPEQVSQAQSAINESTHDCIPAAYKDLVAFKATLGHLRQTPHAPLTYQDKDSLITPMMMIKAHAGMFHYDLLREIAEDILYTVDYIETLNTDALDLIDLQVRILNHTLDQATPAEISPNELELIEEIDAAIDRYRKKHPQSTPDAP